MRNSRSTAAATSCTMRSSPMAAMPQSQVCVRSALPAGASAGQPPALARLAFCEVNTERRPAIGYGAANAHRGTVTDVVGVAGMLDWRDGEQGAPELARLGRARLDATRLAMLATLRRDGSP